MAHRLFLIAPIAVAVSAAFVGAAAGPAVASTTSICETAPAQLRSAAATADANAQRKALHLVGVGVQLCEANASFEAKKQFSAAARVLGTDLAQLPVATASAQ